MAAVTVAEMREIEKRAIDAGVSEDDLMEMAGTALGRAIASQFPSTGMAVGYIGKGHNAGDTLIALRVLRDEFGWKIGVRSAYPVMERAELTRAQRVSEGDTLPEDFHGSLLLLDGLLGIGAKGALREPLAGLAREMETLRRTRGVQVVAVDLPSGVDPDSGEIFPGAVVADRTFMIGAAKTGLLMAGAANSVGSLALVLVPGLKGGDGEMEMIAPQTMDFGKAPREFDFHKGKAGRVGIVAGSRSFSGAALISTLGAIQAGGGLVTLYVRKEAYDAIRARLPFEAMLKPCDDPTDLLDENLDSIVVGPGLGEMTAGFSSKLLRMISETKVPMVVDADGLNLISRHNLKLNCNHLLTPHPGEFKRLAPKHDGKSREEAAREFVAENGAILLLKGSRTIVAKNGAPLRINSTGTPAMSNGGQGDLLSGVIGALLASGMKPFDAAAFGAWLCGHAAELSFEKNGGVCTATDVAAELGSAMRSWRLGRR